MDKLRISRRDFVRSSSSAAGLMLIGKPLSISASSPVSEGSSPPPGTPTDQHGFGIPSCAWKRALGTLPPISLMPEGPDGHGAPRSLNTLARVKKGIPQGGIGADRFNPVFAGIIGRES